ncbi:hypothetical protein NBRC3293_1041 [Gluconobacter oxydans NBRC 3293]|uniref:Uncharacterized protein n=1 Tax=Gluconobacter oxydans NBRC 3293 TaxID=1315969 RepID=A0A829WXH0_GLUOY|nr:hypothetical protein NBRC3293_1041 [Gluconobacter oxydans NBRC 3293]
MLFPCLASRPEAGKCLSVLRPVPKSGPQNHARHHTGKGSVMQDTASLPPAGGGTITVAGL